MRAKSSQTTTAVSFEPGPLAQVAMERSRWEAGDVSDAEVLRRLHAILSEATAAGAGKLSHG